jgi:GNAT superfamily N-acetyltransferase
MNDFKIREATVNDIPVILSFIRELAVYEKLLHEVTATEATLREWLFDRAKAEALIGERDGIPVGYAVFFYNFSTFVGRAGIYLEDVYVTPKERGKGYGKSFLKKIAALAVERGCGRFEWTCLDWNLPSIGFYRSLGAEPMNEWTIYRVAGENLRKLAE